MAHPLESLYPYVPVWAQNIGVSLFGLAWRHERLGGDFAQEVAGFQERDQWSPDQMAEYLEHRLRVVVQRAFAEVPYYARKWRAAGVTSADLLRFKPEHLPLLPVTPKADLRANPDDFVARDAVGFGLNRHSSSGSTGTPIVAISRAEDHRRFIAAREVRSFGWAGASVRDARSMIGGRRVVPRGTSEPPYHRYNFAEKQVYFSAYHISPATAPEYVRVLNQYRPALLTGYAHSHFTLAKLMVEQGLTLDYRPSALVLSSEKLTPEMKSVIHAAFDARAFEEYGAVENCVLATECEHGSLHVSPDFGILEIIDGQIVGTSLLNSTQLLVRYETGDSAVWSDRTCACGRAQLPVLAEIVGRLEDVVIAPDGRELVRFHWVFTDLPHVREGQIIQETLDQLTIKLVVTDGYGPTDEATIRRRFAERLGPMRLRFEQVPAIPRTERGKFRGVINRLRRPEVAA